MHQVKAIMLAMGMVSLVSCGPQPLFENSGGDSAPEPPSVIRTSEFEDDFGKPHGDHTTWDERSKDDNKDLLLIPMDPEGIGLTPEDFT